jgi:hypothetical protein
VLQATRRVLAPLSAVYPELAKPGQPSGPAADGSVKRKVQPMDFDKVRDEAGSAPAEGPAGERGMRDANAAPANPADQGMLSWLGFGADANRGLVSSDAIGERDLLSLLEGITNAPRAESMGNMPTRPMRVSAPTPAPAVVSPEEEEEEEEEEEVVVVMAVSTGESACTSKATCRSPVLKGSPAIGMPSPCVCEHMVCMSIWCVSYWHALPLCACICYYYCVITI